MLVQKISREAQGMGVWGEPWPALIFWIVMHSSDYVHWASVWPLPTSDLEVDQPAEPSVLSLSVPGLGVPNESDLSSSCSSFALKVTSASLTRSDHYFMVIASLQTSKKHVPGVWVIMAPLLWVLRVSCVSTAAHLSNKDSWTPPQTYEHVMCM